MNVNTNPLTSLTKDWMCLFSCECITGGWTADFPSRANYCLHYIYLLTAIGLTHSGSSTVHIYTQTVHRTSKLKKILSGRNVDNSRK